MQVVILTGMSGAGKSTALKMLEDMGYFCMDNLPLVLMDKFVELADTESGRFRKVAVSVDVRSGRALEGAGYVLDDMKRRGLKVTVLFLDASDDVLIKRYKETRRSHPLAGGDRIDKGIRRERHAMEYLRARADYIIDTSQLLTRELKADI